MLVVIGISFVVLVVIGISVVVLVVIGISVVVLVVTISSHICKPKARLTLILLTWRIW